ncbi:MAG: hypothetical protein KA314_28635 [Chloroflexi bacterium]|nr:hypothetical protein [Chloroflexota bacterium]MBP8059824.1 hypothetical protein [Chloroflexota bacterium]
MKPPDYLTSLLAIGSIAYSSIPTGVLKEWLNLKLVELEIKNQRRRLIVTDHNGLSQWCDANYPASDIDIDLEGQRAHNIAQKRNSKRGVATHLIQPILLRWFTSKPQVWPAQWTAEYGVVGVRSDRLTNLPWPEKWALLLVENWEPFYRSDYSLSDGTLVVIYLGGQVSDVTLQAIAQLAYSPSLGIHWGDYDWAGLQIYQRVHQLLPQVKLYVPSNIETLFARYGQYQLINQPIIIKETLPLDPQVQHVAALISQYNSGLEQEIVTPPSSEMFSPG